MIFRGVPAGAPYPCGHPRTEENTYASSWRRPSGKIKRHRQCAICNRASMARWRRDHGIKPRAPRKAPQASPRPRLPLTSLAACRRCGLRGAHECVRLGDYLRRQDGGTADRRQGRMGDGNRGSVL